MIVRKQLDYALARLFKGKAFIIFCPMQIKLILCVKANKMCT